jgi:hypothetical protein
MRKFLDRKFFHILFMNYWVAVNILERIFPKLSNDPNGKGRGLGETDS